MSYRIGIDAGSKTIKVVILDDEGNILHSRYQRHLANIRETLIDVLHHMSWCYGDFEGPVAVTGSAGISIAKLLGLPFVQEVVATTRAVQEDIPEADAVIELGGEDAKVIYLTGGLEQRMNATCAGGTGGFIDTIAFMLGSRAKEFDRLARGVSRTYPIASRCVVFAQTDVRPLLNAGARTADIAASALDAVVRQTLGGLACGRPIRGTVVFLGGPLEHINELVLRFREALGLNHKTGIKPKDAHLFTAKGAALAAGDTALAEGESGAPASNIASLAELEQRIREAPDFDNDLPRLPPLFTSDEEREQFVERHRQNKAPRKRIFGATGDVFLGIDAGSTTVKLVLIDEDKNIIHSDYQPTEGDTLSTVSWMLEDMYRSLPREYGTKRPYVNLAHATVTGYGEDLLKLGLGIDSGIVETTAHARAASELVPDASFVLDIGGQDIKALWLKDGLVTEAVLNEACSSGCGSFIEGTAYSLRSRPAPFALAALKAEAPVDLGSKCTVFMTSRVRHAQKVGATLGDLAAGLAYSVVYNALYRIIGVDRMPTLGDHIVVQGGAFKSDAVLRAFELVTGREVARPDTAHLMGAYGAALVARERALDVPEEKRHSTLLPAEELADLQVTRTTEICPGCSNACTLSIVTFGEGRRSISGQRCDRAREFFGGADEERTQPHAPNIMALEQKLLARLTSEEAPAEAARGSVVVGLLDTLYEYEQLPFWHRLFTALGFSVAVPREGATSSLSMEAAETIPAESICYPAKLAHGRFFELAHAGAQAVFAPLWKRGRHCPVACDYNRALADALSDTPGPRPTLVMPELQSQKAASLVELPKERAALLEALAPLCEQVGAPLSLAELEEALAEAAAAQAEFTTVLQRATEQAQCWIAEDPARHGIIISGRPYHADPAVLHGIDRVLTRLGMAVLSDRWVPSITTKGLRAAWGPAKHAVATAVYAAGQPQLDVVFLQSFGCGYDAVAFDEARDVLERASKPATLLKIDDIVDTAHIRIRLRTLAEGIETTRRRAAGADGAKARETSAAALPANEGASRSEVVSQNEGAAPSGGDVASLLPPPPPEPTTHIVDNVALAWHAGITHEDMETVLSHTPADLCSTAAALTAHIIDEGLANPELTSATAPYACKKCLVDALPSLVERALGRPVAIEWLEESPAEEPEGAAAVTIIEPAIDPEAPFVPTVEAPLIGIIGNPLLCFDPLLNEDIVELLGSLGCRVALPSSAALYTDDVRYLDQLQAFSDAGVQHVIYLQSFGCLKGNVQMRGSAHELAHQFPDLPITVLDYDAESSRLNRENRIRLVVESCTPRSS